MLRAAAFLFAVTLFLNGCSKPNEPVYAVSLSSDGNYAISSHRDNSVILWDIANESKTIISRTGNIYSAYFIRNTDQFMWQDLDKTVYIKNVHGKQIEQFNFPFHTYSHIISSNLKTYITSDKDYTIRIGRTDTINVLKASDDGSFSGFGKLLNLSIDNTGKFLLSSGYAWSYPDSKMFKLSEQKIIHYKELYGPTLWDLQTLKPIKKLPGNSAKTYATFSPDGKNIISVCENGIGIIWDVKQGKIIGWLDSLFFGRILDRSLPVEQWKHDGSNVIKMPDSFSKPAMISVKYIYKNHFLRFTINQPYAILYTGTNTYPTKVFELGKRPLPAVFEYSRNTAIDTASDAGILVTGQRDGSGINVYKFDKDKLTLKKIWVTN